MTHLLAGVDSSDFVSDHSTGRHGTMTPVTPEGDHDQEWNGGVCFRPMRAEEPWRKELFLGEGGDARRAPSSRSAGSLREGAHLPRGRLVENVAEGKCSSTRPGSDIARLRDVAPREVVT